MIALRNSGAERKTRRLSSFVGLPLLAIVLLAGCADLKKQPSASTAPATKPAATAPSPAPVPEDEAVASLPPASAEPTFDEDPNDLMGLNAASLESLLGEPELLRREQPAQVWQYRTNDCVFDVVLYDDSAGSRVNYIEARDKRGNTVATRPCYNAILKARARATAG